MSDTITNTSPVNSTLSTQSAEVFPPEPEESTNNSLVFDISRGFASGLGMTTEFDLGELKGLIEMQMDFQRQMQEVTMLSNIEKSKHESRMAPIRNIRVG